MVKGIIVIMNIHNISMGFMSALLPCTGGAMLIIQAANTAGFSRPELISWMFAVFVLGGLLNLGLTLKYLSEGLTRLQQPLFW